MTLSFMEDQVSASADAIVGAINKLALSMARIEDSLKGIESAMEGIESTAARNECHSIQEELTETLKLTSRELTYIGEGVRKLS
jgi:hypothetical protein